MKAYDEDAVRLHAFVERDGTRWVVSTEKGPGHVEAIRLIGSQGGACHIEAYWGDGGAHFDLADISKIEVSP